MEDNRLERLKKVELSILEEFDRVCKKNKINYTIGYGTLLGAVRHKGFIPWDDDIDIMMTLDNYIRFEKLAPKTLKKEFYFQSRNINPQNYVFWNRIGLKNTTSIDLEFKNIKADWGICIDIFPIFKVSNNKTIRKIEIKILNIYTLLALKYYHKATFKKTSNKLEKIKKGIHILIPDFLNKFVSNLIIKYFSRYNKKETEYCLECYEYYNAGLYKTKWFDEYETIKFEGKKFQTIKAWDDYLKTQYGDYMIPPKDKTKHSDNPNVFIDFENSYIKYINK